MHGFDSRIGGSAEELCERYPNADEAEKDAIVEALCKYRAVSPAIVERLYIFFESEENPNRKSGWLAHLSKFGYAQTDSLLRAGLNDSALYEKALYALHSRFHSREKVNGRTVDIWSPEVEDWYANILAAFPLAATLSPDSGVRSLLHQLANRLFPVSNRGCGTAFPSG